MSEPENSPSVQPRGGLVLPVIAILGSAAIAIPLLTSAHTALPTPLWVGVVTALALVGAMALPDRAASAWFPVFALCAGVAAAAAHLQPGVVLGHDTQHHVWGAWAWMQAWEAGDYFPVWLHHVGLGMPLPMFYGPLPFYAMAPTWLAGGGVDRMLELSYVTASALIALGAYFVVRSWTGDRRAALVAAMAAAFAPYRQLDASYRAALGETWGLAVLPLLFFAFERLLARARRLDFVLAAVATALLALTHPLSLLMLFVLLPVLWLARQPPWSVGAKSSFAAALRGVTAGITGLALAGVFVLPLAVELDHTSLGASVMKTGGPGYLFHGLHVGQLFERRLWEDSEWSTRDDDPNPPPHEMPYYVGYFLIAGLVAAIPADRLAKRPAGSLRALGVTGLGALALSLLPVARFTSRTFHLINTLQFPWRFLGPASVLGALALGVLLADVRGSRWGVWLTALVALGVLADGFPYTGAVGRVEPWSGLAYCNFWPSGSESATTVPQPWSYHVDGQILPPRSGRREVGSLAAYREYLTPQIRAAAENPESSIAIVYKNGAFTRPTVPPYARVWRRGHAVPLAFERGAGTLTVFPRRQDRRIEIAEQYFPGWQVEIAGKWREVTPSAAGLLAVDLDARAERVRFRFDRWRWDRLAGWILTVLTATALLVIRRVPFAPPAAAS